MAFEEGTQAQWLHDLLQPHVERVLAGNVRGKSEVSNKSDRIDAEQLSELLRVGSLKTVYHGTSSVLTLRRREWSCVGNREAAEPRPRS